MSYCRAAFLLSSIAMVSGAEHKNSAGTRPSIRSSDGNLVIHVEEGKEVGFKIGGEAVVYFNQIPEDMQNYSNVENIAAINALTLGYSLGAGSVTGQTDAAKVLDFLSKKVQSDLEEVRATAENASSTAEEAKVLANVMLSDASSSFTMPVVMTVSSKREQAQFSVHTKIVAPGGGEVNIGGTGISELLATVGVWDPALVTCEFRTVDGNGNIADKILATEETRFSKTDMGAVLTCNTPPIDEAGQIQVSLKWQGAPAAKTLEFMGAAGSNIVTGARWYSDISFVDHVPTASGVGFGKRDVYTCIWYVSSNAVIFTNTDATFGKDGKIRCAVLPADSDVVKAFNSKDVGVTVDLKYKKGQEMTAMPRSKPKSIKGNAGPSGKALAFQYSDHACFDGLKDGREIGIDCGLKSCGALCKPSYSVEREGTCDRSEDCKGGDEGSIACRDGKCAYNYFSCYDVKKFNNNAKPGVYKIVVDSEPHDRSKVEVKNGEMIDVYCAENDGQFWTVVEMLSSSSQRTTPWNWMNEMGHLPKGGKSIGQMWKENQNQNARVSAVAWNSIFKHSLGQVRQLYNNNKPTYHMTDVFGTDTKHLMDNTCSDKASLNMALGYRERSGTSMGYCFKNGQYAQSTNCICGDQQSMGSGFNKCAGNHGNWRRYNMEKSRNLNCRGMHTKCYSVSNHGILGDTYGCNGPNGRNVQGHMWQFYYSNRGMPCHGYGAYGCYGARWIG